MNGMLDKIGCGFLWGRIEEKMKLKSKRGD